VEQVVVIDTALKAKLHDLTVPLELRDESGHVLGHYVPKFKPDDFDELVKTCPFTDEELERFGQEPGGRTLAEIWKRQGRTE
jgi:hypothetical protein